LTSESYSAGQDISSFKRDTCMRLIQHLFAVYCEFLEAAVFVVTVGPNYERLGQGKGHKALPRLVRT